MGCGVDVAGIRDCLRMEIHFPPLSLKILAFLSGLLLCLDIKLFSRDYITLPHFSNIGGQCAWKMTKVLKWLIIPDTVVLCGLFVSLQLAPQGVAVDVGSRKAWQGEKTFTQTQGALNSVAMGDDASWFCCCHGNSCTWPNLVQTSYTKDTFSSAASTIFFFSSELENTVNRNIFPRIFTTL